MIDAELQKTILSQYSNAPRLREMFELANEGIDPSKGISDFFVNVFDLDTCGQYGLDVWADIVQAPKTLEIFPASYFGFKATGFHPFRANHPGLVNDNYFEFDPVSETIKIRKNILAGAENPFFEMYEYEGQNYLRPRLSEVVDDNTYWLNDNGQYVRVKDNLAASPDAIVNYWNFPFYNGVKDSSQIKLEGELFRALIYFKGAANIMNTSVPRINELLNQFFDILGKPGNLYAQDLGGMRMRVFMNFDPGPVARIILRRFGNLLRPGGVNLVYDILPDFCFGFKEGELQPFNAYPFYDGRVYTDEYYRI
jgi:hypothetical protein